MDYSNKCRLCLREIEDKENSVPLFKEKKEEESDEDVVSMISFCVSLKVKNITILPSKICITCFDDLKKCKEFKRKCQDSDSELTKYLEEQDVPVKEEPIVEDKNIVPLLTPEVTLTEGSLLKNSSIPSTIKHDPNIKLKEVKIRIKKLSELNGKCDIKSEVKKSDDTDEDAPLSDIAHTVKKETKEKYQCRYCEETFRREVTKQVHEKTHKILYKCVLCYESFHTHSKLQKHRKDIHNEDPYCCSFCSKTFSNIHTWTNHLKKNHVSCFKCKSYFKSKSDLDNHDCLTKKGKKKGLKKSSEELQNRIQYDLPTARRSKSSQDKRKLPKKNYYQIKKQKLIEAAKLTEFVPVSSGQKEHFLSEDNRQRGQFPCNRCDQDFADKGSLICHQAVAHPGQPIDNTQRPPKKSVLFCKFCLSFFRHFSDMQSHICQRNVYPVNQSMNPINMTQGLRPMSLVESMEKTLPIPVSLYKKTFKTYSREQFLPEEKKQRGKFPCNSCDRDFADKSSLICHQAVAHLPIDDSLTDDKQRGQFPCSRCDQDFADKSSLICHEAVAHHCQPIEDEPPPNPPEIIEKKPVISKLLPAPSVSKVYSDPGNFSHGPSVSKVYGTIPTPSNVIIKQEHIEEDIEESILPEPQISIKTDDIPCNQYFNPNKRKKYFGESESPESVFRVNPNILETLGIRQDMTL